MRPATAAARPGIHLALLLLRFFYLHPRRNPLFFALLLVFVFLRLEGSLSEGLVEVALCAFPGLHFLCTDPFRGLERIQTWPLPPAVFLKAHLLAFLLYLGVVLLFFAVFRGESIRVNQIQEPRLAVERTAAGDSVEVRQGFRKTRDGIPVRVRSVVRHSLLSDLAQAAGRPWLLGQWILWSLAAFLGQAWTLAGPHRPRNPLLILLPGLIPYLAVLLLASYQLFARDGALLRAAAALRAREARLEPLFQGFLFVQIVTVFFFLFRPRRSRPPASPARIP